MANNKIYNIINYASTIVPHRMLLLIFLLSSCIYSLKPVVVNEPRYGKWSCIPSACITFLWPL